MITFTTRECCSSRMHTRRRDLRQLRSLVVRCAAADCTPAGSRRLFAGDKPGGQRHDIAGNLRCEQAAQRKTADYIRATGNDA
jgi:hypothetical protein